MGPTSSSRKIFLVSEMPTKVLVADAAKSPSESEVMQALVVTVFYLFFSSLQIAIIRNIYVVIMDKDENNN